MAQLNNDFGNLLQNILARDIDTTVYSQNSLISTGIVNQNFAPQREDDSIGSYSMKSEEGANVVDESYSAEGITNSKYGDKIASLFKNMDLTDVNLHVGDEVIKVCCFLA